MKIIGYKEKKKRREKYYKFTCKNCGCIYVISNNDKMWRHDFWGRNFPICPNCHEETITWFTFNHRIRNLDKVLGGSDEK